MKIIKLKNNFAEIIKSAILVLKSGGVIAYPTETAYGLGADFFNQDAVKKVYQIKGRNYKKPLSVIVANLPMAKKLVKFDKISLKLAKKYWPGALTLVLPELHNNKTLALRVSANILATNISKQLRCPITATSANLSGNKELYSAVAVKKEFAKKKFQPDLIIDTGRLPMAKVSTIVAVKNKKIKILRQGSIEL